MIPTNQYSTIPKMYKDLVKRFFLGDPSLCHQHGLPMLLTCYSQAYKVSKPTGAMDLGSVGYTSARWKQFLNAYVDAVELKEWVHKVVNSSETSEVSFRFKEGGRHKYGGCLIALSFRKYDETLTLMSRATQIAPTGALELSLVGLLSDHLREHGFKPKFLWWIQQLQFRIDFAVPYFLRSGLVDEIDPVWSTVKYVRGLGEKYANGHVYKYTRYNSLAKQVLGSQDWKSYYPTLDGLL